MDWARIKRLIYVALLDNLLIEKHYWKLSFFNLFLGGILYIIYYIFAGNFIQQASNIKEYLFILIIGVILAKSFWQSFGSIIRLASNLRRIARYYIFAGFLYIFAFHFFWDLKVITYMLLGYFIVPFILGYLSSEIFVFILLFSLVIMFSSYAFGLILSPLFIYARKEAYDLVWVLEDAIGVIVPTTFLISYFYFYKITVLVPPIVLIEEFRKLLLYQSFDLNILLQALVISFIYFLIGFWMFRKSFDMARRKGWVKLV